MQWRIVGISISWTLHATHRSRAHGYRSCSVGSRGGRGAGVVKFRSLTDEADSGCYCGSLTESMVGHGIDVYCCISRVGMGIVFEVRCTLVDTGWGEGMLRSCEKIQ